MGPYYAGSGTYFLTTLVFVACGIFDVIFSLGVAGRSFWHLFASISVSINMCIGNLIALSFFASPLSVMQTVLKERSTAAMPFAVSIASFANCLAWATYGLFVIHDPMVAHLFASFGVCLISCYCRLRFRTSVALLWLASSCRFLLSLVCKFPGTWSM